jgi:hypothetical protein
MRVQLPVQKPRSLGDDDLDAAGEYITPFRGADDVDAQAL